MSLGIAGLAAWLGLEWRGELPPGETVLVLGASGVVGQIAVQAARLMGAGRVVAAARGAGGLERARRSGPTRPCGSARTATSRRRSPRPPGAGSTWSSIRCGASPPSPRWPRSTGSAATCSSGSRRARRRRFPPPAIRGKPVSIVGHTNFSADHDRLADAYARMAEHAAAGKIEVEVERVPLDQVAEAWRRRAIAELQARDRALTRDRVYDRVLVV